MLAVIGGVLYCSPNCQRAGVVDLSFVFTAEILSRKGNDCKMPEAL